MRLTDLDYDLPTELIAQEPARPRDSSRLLVLHRESGEIEDLSFADLLHLLAPSDVVALNDTQVIPARLFATVDRCPEKEVEVLLLRQESGAVWHALVRPGRRARRGDTLAFGHDVRGEVLAVNEDGSRLIRFFCDAAETAGDDRLGEALQRIGVPPLPPYITAPLKNPSDYQTVYATAPGAVAAPTAGLHFSPTLLAELRARVRAVHTVTLHIGPWTFRPIKSDMVEQHPMSTERFTLTGDAAEALNAARAQGGRLLAVGTSTCRVLESCVNNDGRLVAREGETDLFIMPGYHFGAVDMLLTNFHLPRSTNLLLVCAFAGRDAVLRAYRHAVQRRYRFFSFGDAMLVL